jgi:CRP-like cAMP-binding protein
VLITHLAGARTFLNDVLSSLPPQEIERIRPHLSRMRLVQGQTLYEPNQRAADVFFIEQGFVSMIAQGDSARSRTETALIGREGMAGLPAALDPHGLSFNLVVMPTPGIVHLMSAQILRDSMAVMPVLRQRVFAVLQILMAQVEQTAACNSQHTLPERLTRWLLMAHDRIEGDELPLTQEFLSNMLAVRRSGVTVALASLREAGAIEYSRRCIVIRDRASLQAASCACYGRVRTFAQSSITRILAPVSQP